MLITGSTASTDDLANVSVISWTNTASMITIGSGDTVAGQQYISFKGTLLLGFGSTIASDNWIYEYGTVLAGAGRMGMPGSTISSPTVLLEPGSTVTEPGGTAMMPGLSILGTVEQDGALNVGAAMTFGTASITGAYTINNTGVTTIYGSGTLSYSGTTPL
jgi:hypothetical protein